MSMESKFDVPAMLFVETLLVAVSGKTTWLPGDGGPVGVQLLPTLQSGPRLPFHVKVGGGGAAVAWKTPRPPRASAPTKTTQTRRFMQSPTFRRWTPAGAGDHERWRLEAGQRRNNDRSGK